MSLRKFVSRWHSILMAGALVAGAFVTTGGGVAAAVESPSHPSQPNFGSSVYIFNPSTPQSQIQATVDAVAAQQVSNQFGTQRYALLFEPGTYGSSTNPLNFQVGYYTAVAGLGLSERRRDQRVRLRPQPVLQRAVHRARELLAIAVEPDDQRDHPGLRLLQRRILAGLTGGADAPSPRQRARHPDGLLHRSVLRQRRLHRRFKVRRHR